MSWDEKLFGWAWRRSQALFRRADTPEVLERRVAFDEVSDRLRTLAIAIAGWPITVREAEAEGGVAAGVILLPRFMDFAGNPAENERAYVLRVALAATIARLRLVPRAVTLDPIERTLATLLAVERAKEHLAGELPASVEALEELSVFALAARTETTPSDLEAVVRATLGGRVEGRSMAQRVMGARPADVHELVTLARTFARELGGASTPPVVPLWGWLAVHDAGADAEGPGTDPGALPRGTERVMRPRDHVTRKKLDQRPLSENPLIHSFEKLHTLEEHGGGKKRVDGSDELEAHADALEELDLREVIRSDEQTASLLRSDAMFESGAGDFADRPRSEGLPYDEWNEASRGFRPAWCRVRVSTIEETVEPAAAERLVARMHTEARPRIDALCAELARLELARRPRARQLDGPDVDDDAMVDRYAALAAGATPPDRLYRSRRRHIPDLAVLLLVDASLSTDGWIDGRRVLDVERDATLVLAEALIGSVDELGIAAFSSHTRSDCRFSVVKGMREPWPRVRRRLMSLAPSGYTRIGPALRHATTILERTAARRRLLLVVTDGKPNDYDRYEGRYGVFDVAHAVLEAGAHGIHVHALAIDREARHTLPQMFRPGGFTVLGSPKALAPAMGTVVASMQR